jgi:hypothetical protein
MKFDIDRFAKLAGIRGTVEAPKSAAPAAPAAVLKESASRLEESAEIKNLRRIIREETRSILTSKKASKKTDEALVEGVQRSKSLTEAMVTLGFLGPGFGGNNAFVLGGPMTSASKIASLHEEDEGHDLPYGYSEEDEVGTYKGLAETEEDETDEGDESYEEPAAYVGKAESDESY